MEEKMARLLTEIQSCYGDQENENKILKDRIVEKEMEIDKLRKDLQNARDETLIEENARKLPDGRSVILGINDITKRNEEAIHDAMMYFEKQCPYCGQDLFKTNIRQKIEIDHFIPISKGGQDVPWNLLPSCTPCNRSKRDKMPYVFLDIAKYNKCYEYLLSVKEIHYSETIEAYVNTYTLEKLVENYDEFIKRNISSNFIIEFLQLIYPSFLDYTRDLKDESNNIDIEVNKTSEVKKDELPIFEKNSEVYIEENLCKKPSDEGDSIIASLLYEKYQEWALKNGKRIETQTSFGRSMHKYGYFSFRNRKGTRAYINVVLKE